MTNRLSGKNCYKEIAKERTNFLFYRKDVKVELWLIQNPIVLYFHYNFGYFISFLQLFCAKTNKKILRKTIAWKKKKKKTSCSYLMRNDIAVKRNKNIEAKGWETVLTDPNQNEITRKSSKNWSCWASRSEIIQQNYDAKWAHFSWNAGPSDSRSVRYRNEDKPLMMPVQSYTDPVFLACYWTEPEYAGMPKPALVSSMLMLSYAK